MDPDQGNNQDQIEDIITDEPAVAGAETVEAAIPAQAPSVSDLGSTIDLNSLAPPSPAGGGQNQALLDIKHKALSKLGDLVDNLEHSPEQHFQTLMMIIQETDNIQMIDKAYETALQFKDAKERAQALLAIANEINYFTSKQPS